MTAQQVAVLLRRCGLSYNAIARDLDELGFRPPNWPRNRVWLTSHVSKLLTDEKVPA